MSRQRLLNELLNRSRPLVELREELAKLPWDSPELVTLKPMHIDARLMEFTTGKIDARALTEWANCIEGREDIGFDAQHVETLRDVIDELANPDLYSVLTVERANSIRQKLAR